MAEETNYKIMTENKEGEIHTGEVLGDYTVADKETDHQMPMRLIYQGRKLKYNRGRLWLLQAFGSFTLGELAEFQQRYSKELTIDETEVISLLMKSLSGDVEARALVWDLNKEIFRATKQVYIEQMKAELAQGQTKSVSRLESMLEEIGDKITGVQGTLPGDKMGDKMGDKIGDKK